MKDLNKIVQVGTKADFRSAARVKFGEWLYRAGYAQSLFPVFTRSTSGIKRRLLAYLEHYLRTVHAAEMLLELPPLKGQFAVDLNDHMLVPYLYRNAGIYEIAEINFMKSEVRNGDHILDIGANHGLWGVSMAAAAGADSRLHLFEANPRIAKRLKRTLAANTAINARLHEVAVSDGNVEELTFFLPQGNLSGLGSTVLHDFARQRNYLCADDQIRVSATSIDKLSDRGQITAMDVVKIDVEQAEDAVIAGAIRSIQRFKPRLLMIETSLGSQASTELIALGYRASCLVGDRSEGHVPKDYWGNIFFRPGAA